ncbi:MAG: cob(I)yrinic acid a,c-diamide adenosyltransferase [Gammaproteobacteria bacterium]
MSIATKRGDGGQTSLVGGNRVSKGDLRVEAYGSIDELNSVMGFARSICDDAEVHELVKAIQRELFALGAAVATPAENRKKPPPVSIEMVETLTEQVHRIEAIEGVLSDWSLPGEHPAASAFDVARTVCRRAERDLIRLMGSGEHIDPEVLAYLNRLSDLLWLFGRLIEARAGLDASLRDEKHKGNRWSRAW